MSIHRLLLIFLILASTAATTSAAVLDSYAGRVVDAETSAPVKGATVVVSWDKATPTPAGAVGRFVGAFMCETGDDGTYHFSAKIEAIGLLSYVDGVTFLVYQPGYAGFGRTYYDSAKVEETRLIKLQRLTSTWQAGQFHDEFEEAIFRIDPRSDENDNSLNPQKPFEALLKGVPEREVLRARSGWERLFRREE